MVKIKHISKSLYFFFFSLDGKETKDQADSMTIISDDCRFPAANRRNHPAIRGA
jgi:uncharacterized protein (DUF1919 family)